MDIIPISKEVITAVVCVATITGPKVFSMVFK
jgi:hypothetical protein